MKTMKLNFNLNEATPSGRFYNVKNFAQKMNEQIKKGTFFFEYSGKYSSMSVDLKKIIGFIDKCKINKNGEVTFTISSYNEEDSKCLNSMDECALSATGYTDNKGNTLVNRIICLRPSPEYVIMFDNLDHDE